MSNLSKLKVSWGLMQVTKKENFLKKVLTDSITTGKRSVLTRVVPPWPPLPWLLIPLPRYYFVSSILSSPVEKAAVLPTQTDTVAVVSAGQGSVSKLANQKLFANVLSSSNVRKHGRDRKVPPGEAVTQTQCRGSSAHFGTALTVEQAMPAVGSFSSLSLLILLGPKVSVREAIV